MKPHKIEPDETEYQWMKDSIDIPQRQTKQRLADTLRGQQELKRRQKIQDRICWFLFWCLMIGLGVPIAITEFWRAGR